MTEVVTKTRSKKSGGFVDERTAKAMVSYLIYVVYIFFNLLATL